MRRGELGKPVHEADPRAPAKLGAEPLARGDDVPDIAEPVLTGYLRLRPAERAGELGRQFADAARGAAGDVERPERSCCWVGGPRRGCDVRLRHVADMNEITELPTVLEDLRYLPAGQRRTEDRGDPGVGGVDRHPGAIDVVVAQRGDGPARHPCPRRRKVLLHELGRRVHVARIRRSILADQAGQQGRAAVRAARLEPASRQISHQPRARTPRPVQRALVTPLAVDHHRGCEHKPPYARCRHLGQQHRGAEIISAHILRSVGEAGTEADHRRLMADEVDAPKRRCDGFRIAHIRADEVPRAGGGLVGWGGRTARPRLVRGDQRAEHIEPGHRVTFGGKGVHDVRADETRSAGNQYPHDH